ncbi:hypothetical protein [Paenibacillus pinihumi]|uniref:hypothetical protein n=1 Tax=Paenibacillus pinihumi TaxID=669462 RepID=UPI0012B5F733|nr:hypothetical protein [Paenibacillus pinihumi]
MKKKRLIIVDGMPGSGKSTSASMIAQQLATWGKESRCVLEQEDNNPLLLTDFNWAEFQHEEQQDKFIALLEAKFRKFVDERLQGSPDLTIIESVLFQDAINCAHHSGMNRDKLHKFTASLQQILAPLEPVLVYFYQVNPEAQWRYICNIRGNEWGPVSLHTDEDFREAGELWGSSQAFVRSVVDEWQIPKLIIENTSYDWDRYTREMKEFVYGNLVK